MGKPFKVWGADRVADAADELASTFHHAGFIMKRELGDPDDELAITPAEFRRRSLARSRPGIPPLGAKQRRLALYALGMTGEAGEVADEIKKILFHGKALDRDKLLDEIGDVLWYVDRLLDLLGFTFDDALAANDEKLAGRYPDGWDAAAKHYDHEAQ